MSSKPPGGRSEPEVTLMMDYKNKLQREEKKKTPHDHVHSEYLAHLKLDTLQKHDYKDRFYTYLCQFLG